MVKESACNAGDLGSIPGPGRIPGGGHDNPLQYSCLDRGAWQGIVHWVAEPDMTQLNHRQPPHGMLLKTTFLELKYFILLGTILYLKIDPLN